VDTTVIQVLLGVIALFAGFVNTFIVFILYVLWGEIKTTQKKLDKDISGVYKEIRKHQDSNDNQLHQIKTQLVQIGLHLKIDFKEV